MTDEQKLGEMIDWHFDSLPAAEQAAADKRLRDHVKHGLDGGLSTFDMAADFMKSELKNRAALLPEAKL